MNNTAKESILWPIIFLALVIGFSYAMFVVGALPNS